MSERKVFKKVGDKWISTSLSFLRNGDIFKMFEPSGEPVKNVDDEVIFLCESDAYETPYGYWGVDIFKNGSTIPPDEVA